MEKVGEFFKKFENKDNPIPIDEFKNMDIYICNNYQYNSLYGVPVYIDLYKDITVTNDKEDVKRKERYIISIEE